MNNRPRRRLTCLNVYEISYSLPDRRGTNESVLSDGVTPHQAIGKVIDFKGPTAREQGSVSWRLVARQTTLEDYTASQSADLRGSS